MNYPRKRYAVRMVLTYVAATALACVAVNAVSAQSVPPKSTSPGNSSDALIRGFKNPPASAKLRCYWWWLNGHTNEATITRDLEQMAKMGYGGALLVDANGSDQTGNDNVPAGPEFGSPAWTALYVHALKEANRLNLEITLNITSGWNLGGPLVKPEDASKLLTWSRLTVHAGQAESIQLQAPPITNGFYRQIAVLAYPLHLGAELPGEKGSDRSALKGLKFKNASAEMGFSMPDASALLTDATPQKKDNDAALSEVLNITPQVDKDGTVHWTPPFGTDTWEILRIGYTDSDARVSTSSGAWQGLAIDYLNPHALDIYWNTSVEPLLLAAKPYVGKSLKYVATDSWELGGTNWTDAFREEFIKRRGYDPVPYLPIVAGRILDDRERSTQFLTDIRRTVADLVNTHYDHLALLAKQHGLGMQCESGGPHGAPFDALETFRSSAIPQTEYWAKSKEHRSSDEDRYFVKEAASAAHIYGRPFAAAEGMTSIGNQWNESIGQNLRPSFDQALTEGMNRLVWHEFTSSPPEMGLPGQEYFAGTHLNPNVTWWRDAGPFFQYLNRSQFLMQQGLPVADVLYYYGNNAPNFVRLKKDDPAKVLPGYDYDVTDSEVLLQRLAFTNGRLHTPEGISYKALVMPTSGVLPLKELAWIEHYVKGGGVLIGVRPTHIQGVVSAVEQKQFQTIADELWRSCETSTTQHDAVGKGHVYCTANSRDALQAMKVLPDFEEVNASKPSLDYIHRISGQSDIYFVRNTTAKDIQTNVAFRTAPSQPQFLHADTGETDRSLLYTPMQDGRTLVPLSLRANESVFIVFEHDAAKNYVTSVQRNGTQIYTASGSAQTLPPRELSITRTASGLRLSTQTAGSYQVAFSNGEKLSAVAQPREAIHLTAPWTLSFPANWGAPSSVTLAQLQSWTDNTDPGVRYFSGTATYRTTLQLTSAQAVVGRSADLDLGDVHEVATVTINGKPAGTLWKSPYIVPVDGLLHAGENRVEVNVTNLWPNRIIGDAQDPAARHYTWTNIRKYTKTSPLLPSGMQGPVTLEPTYRLPLTPHGVVDINRN